MTLSSKITMLSHSCMHFSESLPFAKKAANINQHFIFYPFDFEFKNPSFHGRKMIESGEIKYF